MSQIKGGNDEDPDTCSLKRKTETYRNKFEKVNSSSAIPIIDAENGNGVFSSTEGCSPSFPKSVHSTLRQISGLPLNFKHITVTPVVLNNSSDDKTPSSKCNQREAITSINVEKVPFLGNKKNILSPASLILPEGRLNMKPDTNGSRSFSQIPSSTQIISCVAKSDVTLKNNNTSLPKIISSSYLFQQQQQGANANKSQQLISNTTSKPVVSYLQQSVSSSTSQQFPVSCTSIVSKLNTTDESDLNVSSASAGASFKAGPLFKAKSSVASSVQVQSPSRIVCAAVDKPRNISTNISSSSENITLTALPVTSGICSTGNSPNFEIYNSTKFGVPNVVHQTTLSALAKQNQPAQLKLSDRFTSSSNNFISQISSVVGRNAAVSSPKQQTPVQGNTIQNNSDKSGHSNQSNERETRNVEKANPNGLVDYDDDDEISDHEGNDENEADATVVSSSDRLNYDVNDNESEEDYCGIESSNITIDNSDSDVISDGKFHKYQDCSPTYSPQEQELFVLSSDEEIEEVESSSCLEDQEDEVSLSVLNKEPVITEAEYAFGESNRDSEVELADDVSYCILHCRSVRIGSFKFIPFDTIYFYQDSIRFLSPTTDNADTVTIIIPINSIVKILAHFGNKLPLIFLYITPSRASKIRQSLNMSLGDPIFFDPLSTDEIYKRITFLFERISPDVEVQIKNVFEDSRFCDLTYDEANKILMKCSPKELQKEVKSQPNPVQTIMVFPPAPAKGGISINTEDYACLGEDIFLNDVIIDFYLKYITLTYIKDEVEREKVHVFSSFFYKRLTDKATPLSRRSSNTGDSSLSRAEVRHTRVKNWTKNIDLFLKDFIIIPINENSHWFLAIICFPGLTGPVRMKDDTPVEPAEPKIMPRVNENRSESQTTVNFDSQTRLSKLRTINVDDDLSEEDRDEADGKDEDVDYYVCDEDQRRRSKNVENNEESDIDNEPIKQPCILVFDSLAGASRARIIATLRDYLRIEYKVKHGEDRDFSKNVVKGDCPRVPQQDNFTDCGLYVLQYAEAFITNKIPDYRIPITGLKRWFPTKVCNTKRWEIQQLILKLIKEQNIDTDNLLLPTLKLRPYDERLYDDDDEDDSNYDDSEDTFDYEDDDSDYDGRLEYMRKMRKDEDQNDDEEDDEYRHHNNSDLGNETGYVGEDEDDDNQQCHQYMTDDEHKDYAADEDEHNFDEEDNIYHDIDDDDSRMRPSDSEEEEEDNDHDNDEDSDEESMTKKWNEHSQERSTEDLFEQDDDDDDIESDEQIPGLSNPRRTGRTDDKEFQDYHPVNKKFKGDD